MKPEDRKRLKQHIEMIVEHKEPEEIVRENFKQLQDEVTDLREKNIKLRLDLQTLRFKESQENRFVWWVYQVYARNVLDLVQSVPVMCPCDTEEDVPFIELAARIKEYTEHIYDGTYLDTAMSTEQSNSDVSMTQDVLTNVKTGQSVEIEKLQIRLSEWRDVAMLLVDELNEAKSKQLPTSWEDASVASPAYIAYRNLVDVEDDETNPDYYKQELARRDEIISIPHTRGDGPMESDFPLPYLLISPT